MRGNYAVFGLGSFGKTLTKELSKGNNNVVVVDIDEQKVAECREYVAEAIVADVSNEEVIRELNVKQFDAVVLGMSSHFEALILAVTLLKQEGAKKIYAKASTTIQGKILSRIGVDEVIQPEIDVAERLSSRLTMDNIQDMFKFKDYAIAEVGVPKEMQNKTLRELDLRNRCHITVLLIKKVNGPDEDIWSPDVVLEEDDVMTVFGSRRVIESVFKRD